MKKTIVINIRDTPDFNPFKNPQDLYIGRANKIYGYPHSDWASPFFIGEDGSRAQVINQYEEYIRSIPGLMARIPELEGKRLGCWCKPLLCHGDILVKLLKEYKKGIS